MREQRARASEEDLSGGGQETRRGRVKRGVQNKMAALNDRLTSPEGVAAGDDGADDRANLQKLEGELGRDLLHGADPKVATAAIQHAMGGVDTMGFSARTAGAAIEAHIAGAGAGSPKPSQDPMEQRSWMEAGSGAAGTGGAIGTTGGVAVDPSVQGVPDSASGAGTVGTPVVTADIAFGNLQAALARAGLEQSSDLKTMLQNGTTGPTGTQSTAKAAAVDQERVHNPLQDNVGGLADQTAAAAATTTVAATTVASRVKCPPVLRALDAQGRPDGKEHPKSVQQLLAMGTDVNATGRDGVTALMCSSSAEITRCLLQANADVNQTDYHGSEAFDPCPGRPNPHPPQPSLGCSA